MPSKPLTFCRRPACRTLVRGGGFCAAHQSEAFRQRNAGRERAEDRKFYQSPQWRQLRQRLLSDRPLCEECLRTEVFTPATVMDHMLPREERPDLALDPSNLRGLCASCHNRKTFAAALGSSLCDGPAGAPRREGGSISTA